LRSLASASIDAFENFGHSIGPAFVTIIAALDILACPECSGRLRLIAFVAEARVARRILDHLGLDSTGTPASPARAQPDALELAPDYDVADLVYEQ